MAPDPGYVTKNVNIFNPKIVTKLSENDHGCLSRILDSFLSPIPELKRHWIPDLHLQHCLQMMPEC
jgi:hypothetical protein